MYKENIFLKIVTYGPLVFIPLLVGLMLLVSVQAYNNSFNRTLEKTEQHLFNIEKKALENKVLNISNLITYKKSIIKEELTSRIKHRVDKAYDIATNIYNKNKSSKDSKEIKKIIKDALESLIWNDGESFIWIVDYDGIFNLAPSYLKHLEGKSIINLQDATGRYVIKEEIALTKNKGEGFLWDTFTKPNDKTQKQYKQVAFVKAFGNYDWYFGSSEYIDTATKITDKRLFKTIEQIDNIGSHYIFLMDVDGNLLINKYTQDYVGQNISDINHKAIKTTMGMILDSVKTKDRASLSYTWLNPSTNKKEEKYAFITKVPDTKWVLGSGFYRSDIEAKLSKEKVDMYEVFYKESKYIIYISILVIILSLLISYYVTKKLRKSFRNYEINIDSKTVELQELNDTLEAKVRDRTAELESAKDELEVLATTDILTDMNNRYSLMNILTTEINRSHRYKTPLSIIMYDIDYFKRVNDVHGHDIGDDVLSALSKLVKSSLRDIDIIGRYGGEEFLIILPSTILDDAKYFAQRLREEVSKYNFGGIGNITISLGLAQLQEKETINEFFKRVDELLYESKNNGRNRLSHE